MKIYVLKISLILVGLYLSSFSGMVRVQAAAGDLDPTFGNGGKVFISDYPNPKRVTVQPDGKIVTFGETGGGFPFFTRNNSDGTPDLSFSGGSVIFSQFWGGNYFFSDFVTLPDGKYLITGMKDNSNALFRYNSNGTPDTSFGTNGVLTNSFAGGKAIALQPDGRVIIGGYNSYFIGDDYYIDGGFLIRYNTDGTLDAGFGENGMILGECADNIVLQPDGKFLVHANSRGIVRYNSNGTLDNNFGTNGVVNGDYLVAGIGFQSNGKIIFGTEGPFLSRLERYNENGTLDTTFGTNGRVDITNTSNLGVFRSLIVQRNNKIVTAGSDNESFAVYRFDADGSLDATFGTNGLVTPQMYPFYRLTYITLQPDGKIVAVGEARLNRPYDVGLVRFLGDPEGVELNAVSGRVLTPGGTGLRNAVVTLAAGEVVRTATTSSFGYYSFDNVETHLYYTISVSSKRYRFATRFLLIDSTLTNMDFVGQE